MKETILVTLAAIILTIPCFAALTNTGIGNTIAILWALVAWYVASDAQRRVKILQKVIKSGK